MMGVVGEWQGRSVRNISYFCSFINLANLVSCSASIVGFHWGVLCTGAVQIEKARAVKSGGC